MSDDEQHRAAMAGMNAAIDAAMDEWRARRGAVNGPVVTTAIPVADRFPHVCPKCSAPAYVGLTQVDCSRGCK